MVIMLNLIKKLTKCRFWFILLLLSIFVYKYTNRNWERSIFNLVEYIKDNGYPAEEHTVQTEDGYLLSIYRIPYGINGTVVNKKPVLLNHGLMESSGGFLILGTKRSLGFILADNGYDVWLMNARGTTYSNKHISIDERTNKSEFYNFSWHEIGFYDIPASIDYILNKTSQKQLYYVGHSQGTTSFFVMASTRPEYNKKIKFTVLMSPAVLLKRIKNFFIIVAPYFDSFAASLNNLQIYDIMGLTEFLKYVGHLCQYRIVRPFCQYPYDFLGGYANPDQMDQDMFPKIARTSPSNIAIKQLTHYFQLIRKGKFCQFDYGTEKNLQIYGTPEPPDYKLDLITTPVALYLGKNDHFSVPDDAEALKDILQNVTLFKLVPNDGWNHLNFVFALDVVKVLYNDMIDFMSKY